MHGDYRVNIDISSLGFHIDLPAYPSCFWNSVIPRLERGIPWKSYFGIPRLSREMTSPVSYARERRVKARMHKPMMMARRIELDIPSFHSPIQKVTPIMKAAMPA